MRVPALFVLLFVAAATLAAPPAPLPVVHYYVEATKARDAGDYQGYLDDIEKAAAEIPGHPILLIHTARAQTLLGRDDDALATLRRLARTGAWFDLEADTTLVALRRTPGYATVERSMNRNGLPRGEAPVAIEGGDPLLIPEGITYDPVGDAFFLSSIHDRKVVRAGRDGVFRDFIKPSDDFYGGLGMQVDAGRRHLWVVTAMWPGVGGFTEEMTGFSGVFCYDLETGERLRHVDLSDPNDKHTLNDCALDSNGRLYVTDTTTGALYLIEPGADTLVTFVPDGVLAGGNGLALDEARGLLYVARWSLDVVVVDLATREVSSLQQPETVALLGVDGLYLHESGLIGVQNHYTMDRIARFRLSDDGRRVTGAEVLVGRQPYFEEPTTGVVVGNEFYFIANSQIERFTRSKDRNPADFHPTQIRVVKL